MNKKKNLWILFLALTAILPSCQKDLAGPVPEAGLRPITFTTTIEATDTRVATDALVNTEFDMRDQIGIFAVVRNGSEQARPSSNAEENLMHNVKYIRQVDGSWAADAATGFHIPQGATVDFYAYYPWVENANPRAISYNAAGTGADLMTARALGITESGTSNVALNFRHKLALVQIEVDGQDVLSTMSVNMRNVLHRGILDLSAPDQADEFTANSEPLSIILPNKAGFFCAYVPAQTIPADVSLFELNGGGDNMIYRTAEEAELVTGGIKRYHIIPGAEIADPLSLPNSYLIYPGSRIVIPVAKAFAVWETDALLKESGEDLSGAMTAELVWQDVNGIVSSVSLSGSGREGAITVETDAAKGEGNASVAVKIGGRIFWSWHVWITRYSPNDPANQARMLMDRNLGATTSVYAEDGSIGYQFQWGRKDPIPSLARWTEMDRNESYDIMRDLWDIDGNPVTLGRVGVNATTAQNLVNSIQNPIAFITTDGNANDWYSTTAAQGNDRWLGKGGSKTIYDPCPEGWRVATSGEIFITGQPPMWTHGPLWNDGRYYSAEGRRNSRTGNLQYHDFMAYYWTANPFIDPDDYVGRNGFAYAFEVTGLTYDAYGTVYSRGNAMSLKCARGR
jgi:hypothetical protein